jgi:hypothetical protein
MSMTEDGLDVWDCRFCIASGKNIIWNARKDEPSYADRNQLIQSWLAHQGRCKNRQAADFAKRTSSIFSTSVVKRWAFEFMDTCVDDQGWFDKERAEVYLMERLGLGLGFLEEGGLIDSKGRVWFPCILECAESSNDKRKLKAIKLIPSNEEGKQEGDLKQEEQEGVSKRQKKQSSTTGDDNHIVYENFVCNTI